MKVQILGLPTTEGLEVLEIKSCIYGGGWVEGLLDFFSREEIKDKIFVELIFFNSNIAEVKRKQIGNRLYCAIPAFRKNMFDFSKSLKEKLAAEFDAFKPDIVHIIGTERTSGIIMADIVNKKVPIICSITGLVSKIAEKYCSNLTAREKKVVSMGDFLRGRSISKQQKLFEILGKFEKELIMKTDYVLGRTEWDKACVLQINPSAKYYNCGEILRTPFYNKKWDKANFEKFSIFMPQGTYPLKGLHIALDAIAILKIKYPLVKLIVAGEDITKYVSLKDKLRLSSYGKLIRNKIKKLGIKDSVKFVGLLNAEDMAKTICNSNVFILPSSIANSPNSLAEAMVMGVPSIASYVGGVNSIIEHKKQGYLYSYDEPYMLAYYIDLVFSDVETATELSSAAKNKAVHIYSRNNVGQSLLNIYDEILK